MPFTQLRFIKNDVAFEFEVTVPRDADIMTLKPKAITTDQQDKDKQELDEQTDENDMAGTPQQGQRGQRRWAWRSSRTDARTKTLYSEYDIASGKVTLNEDRAADPRPTWGTVSPDGKWVIFARNHNLYMMDAENWAKAQKNANDTTIVEHQLTKDGEEHYSFGGGGRGGGGQQQQQQQQQRSSKSNRSSRNRSSRNRNARTRTAGCAPATWIWSRDSAKFALVRRDARKVKDLWVIDFARSPRPTLETYRYAMPGEENIPQSEMWVFDVAAKSRTRIKADRFKDQTMSIATAPAPGASRSAQPQQSFFLSDSPASCTSPV